MSIGKRIKDLRRTNQFTQEKVADYLNISYQAVSKWENDISQPDINLLVPLSNLFNVTIEYLLEGKDKDTDDIESIIESRTRLLNDGRVKDSIILLREALSKYPKSFKIMYYLASSLFILPNEHKVGSEEEINREIIKLCTLVYDESPSQTLKNGVRFLMIATYKSLNETSKAKALIEDVPYLVECREALLTLVLTGKEGREHIQTFIFYLLDQLQTRMKQLTYPKFDGSKYTSLERIEYLKKVLDLLDVFFDKTNPIFFHDRYQSTHLQLAKYYAREFLEAETLYHLEKSMYHATAFVSLPKETINYDSIFLDTIQHSPLWTTRNVEETSVDELKKFIEKPEFDFVREKVRFKKLL